MQNVDEFISENKAQATIEQVELEWGRVLDAYHRTAKGPAKYSVEAKVIESQLQKPEHI